jgi:hypothetical protein
VAALALTEHGAEAREALQRYLALPSTGPLKTIAAWKAYNNALGALEPWRLPRTSTTGDRPLERPEGIVATTCFLGPKAGRAKEVLRI